MRTFDFAPLYRSTIGFDRLVDLLDAAGRVEPIADPPPYDIETRGENRYRITMALAGFRPDEVEITQQDATLVVSGARRPAEEGGRHLHRGITTRAVRQAFHLADHVSVTGATLEHGLLTIDLAREVPEALRPRRIPIAPAPGRDGPRRIEHGPARDAAA